MIKSHIGPEPKRMKRTRTAIATHRDDHSEAQTFHVCVLAPGEGSRAVSDAAVASSPTLILAYRKV
jgi:hypothetical protein